MKIKEVIHFLLFIILLFSINSCSKNKENEFREKEDKTENIITSLVDKYNARLVEAREFVDSYTYVIQEFFEENKSKNLIFKSDLNDIEYINNKLFAQFSTLAVYFTRIFHRTIFEINLEIHKDELEKFTGHFIINMRKSELYDYLVYGREPNYIIVANINEIKKIKQYEIGASEEADEIVLTREVRRKIVLYGKLVHVEKL